jgi:SAM-dependent methyltransferase
MKSITQPLINLALNHLAQNNPQAAEDCLTAVLEIEPDNLLAHNLREKQDLPGCFGRWMGVKAEISPDDDIFKFFAGHPTSRNPLRDYLSDGWRTMVELQSVMEKHGQTLSTSQGFLEFASGHGRFTRHLVNRIPQGHLTVSDVVPGCVDFLKDLCGVQGFESNTEPAALRIPGKYQQVFVLSLFSHLPDSTWGAWVERLYSALQPGGILIFSTHGLKCAQQSVVTLNEDGYAFFASSESSAIEGQIYGTAFTSPDYVRKTVASALGAQVQVNIMPNHFWGNQDAVVIKA